MPTKIVKNYIFCLFDGLSLLSAVLHFDGPGMCSKTARLKVVDRGFDASDFGFVCEFFGFSCGSRKITDHDHIMPRNHPISLFKSCCTPLTACHSLDRSFFGLFSREILD